MLLLIGLAVAGGLAATLTPTPQVAVADESQSALLRTGKQLFDTSCVTCHGANLQGVPDRGPSLIGVGEAAVYFQVSTGRMPAMRGEAQAPRKPPIFDESQIDALGAYVQANGGGPTVPRDDNGQVAQESLLGSDVARGGDLFRLNCASCHNFTGKGGALSSGKYAPDLAPAEPAQIYTAMLTGPQNMPKFSDRQLSPEEKKDIVAYVRDGDTGARTPAATASAASDRRPRAWRCGSSASSPSSAWRCGSEREHERRDVKGTDTPGQQGVPGQPSDAELASMSREQLVELGGKLDGVETVFQEDRWPVPDTKAEKRAERTVAYWLLLGGFSGLALLLIFLFWPWEYKALRLRRRVLLVRRWPRRCTA